MRYVSRIFYFGISLTVATACGSSSPQDGGVFSPDLDASTRHDSSSIANSDATAAHDAGVLDASTDAASVSNAMDSGADGGACSPADVSGFIAVTKTPTATHQNLCSATQIADYYTDCLAPNVNSSQCASFVS